MFLLHLCNLKYHIFLLSSAKTKARASAGSMKSLHCAVGQQNTQLTPTSLQAHLVHCVRSPFWKHTEHRFELAPCTCHDETTGTCAFTCLTTGYVQLHGRYYQGLMKATVLAGIPNTMVTLQFGTESWTARSREVRWVEQLVTESSECYKFPLPSQMIKQRGSKQNREKTKYRKEERKKKR